MESLLYSNAREERIFSYINKSKNAYKDITVHKYK